MAVNLHQTCWRHGKDDGTEAAHTFWAAENVPATLPVDTNLLLRLGVQQVEATAASNLSQQFQYNRNGAGWVNITTSSNVCRAVAVAAFTNGQASTQRLATLTGGRDTSNANCTEDGSSGGSGNDVPASGHSETVLGYQIRSADVAHGDTIQFRVTVSGPTTTITYDVTPSATVSVPRRAHVSWGEFEAPSVPRRAYVSWAELEVPTAPRRAFASWGELEIPTAPRRAFASWAELEVPTASRRGFVSWSEFEVPDAGQRAEISWAELEAPDAPRRGLVAWAEVQVPDAPRRAQVAWCELEAPTAPRRGLVAWAELEVPPAPPSFTSYGMPFVYDASEWAAGVFYLKVCMRATVGTVYSRLYNTTDSVPVADSSLETTLDTFELLDSAALTLEDGHTYYVQFGKRAGDAGEFIGAKLVGS